MVFMETRGSVLVVRGFVLYEKGLRLKKCEASSCKK